MHPTIESINATAARLQNFVLRTPTLPYYGLQGTSLFGDTEVWLKMELLQRTGSFKARGAINNVLHLTDEQRANGITAFSAGNHAIATAYAAKANNISAKVVMPKTANPFRVSCCKSLGAEIVFGNTIAELIEIVGNLQQHEGRTLVHPFEGDHTFDGTATVGLELSNDIANLDAVIVPVGGGGLISGIAAAVKQLQPGCAVYGVEPEGAQGMTQSLAAGSPVDTVNVSTIADSLGAPMHMPKSFALVQQYVDDIVRVTDAQLSEVMRLIFTELKLAVEPACAAAMTALLHPLKDKLTGQRVALILCGSNIDQNTFSQYTKQE
jgi:threonine dehydratase